MAKLFDSLTEKHQAFIQKQNMFTVATAMKDGRINISPKGMDTFKVLSENKVIWLNLTGSGNETAIHIASHDRMTIMFSSFDVLPLILRLYGHAKAHHRGGELFEQYIHHFPNYSGARQIIEVDIDLVQTSCGYAVPHMVFKGERETLEIALAKKEELGIESYWKEKNAQSIDGFRSEVY
jgi:hypothetical protein